MLIGIYRPTWTRTALPQASRPLMKVFMNLHSDSDNNITDPLVPP